MCVTYKLHFLRLILPNLMTYVAKIYQIGLFILCYIVNTHNVDMILQIKYMPIVMNPARIASSDPSMPSVATGDRRQETVLMPSDSL